MANALLSVFPVSVKDHPNVVPQRVELYQNFPNPFNPTTTIRFQIPHSDAVAITVYDPLGREVATLANEEMNPGTYERQWNASACASGVYLARLSTGRGTTLTKKMILLR